MIEPYVEARFPAALRFVLEVLAWIAIYFAWGWIPLALSMAALSLLSVRGDKHMVVLPVSGPIRILTELLVGAAGVVAAARAWSWIAAALLLSGYVVLFAVSRPRLRWLWQH